MLLAMAVVLLPLSAEAAAQDKPNILIIWGDDIGQFNISAYNMGMMGYRTPNIDRIAAEGMIFTDAYGENSCTAGRAAFITGQSPFRTGLLKVGLPGAKEGLMEADPTIATLLKDPSTCTERERQEFARLVRRGFDGSDDIWCGDNGITLSKQSAFKAIPVHDALLYMTITVDDFIDDGSGTNIGDPELAACIDHGAAATDGEPDTYDVYLFDRCFENYFWNYDNNGLKNLELRFYSAS